MVVLSQDLASMKRRLQAWQSCKYGNSAHKCMASDFGGQLHMISHSIAASHIATREETIVRAWSLSGSTQIHKGVKCCC